MLFIPQMYIAVHPIRRAFCRIAYVHFNILIYFRLINKERPAPVSPYGAEKRIHPAFGGMFFYTCLSHKK